MSLPTFIIVLNGGLATLAALFTFRAAGHGVPEMRPWHAAGGILAVIYCAAYAWLLWVGVDNSGTWSTWVRPFGLLAWPIGWIIPAVISCRLWRHLNRLGDHHGR